MWSQIICLLTLPASGSAFLGSHSGGVAKGIKEFLYPPCLTIDLSLFLGSFSCCLGFCGFFTVDCNQVELGTCPPSVHFCAPSLAGLFCNVNLYRTVLCNRRLNVYNDLARAKRRWTEKKSAGISACETRSISVGTH